VTELAEPSLLERELFGSERANLHRFAKVALSTDKVVVMMTLIFGGNFVDGRFAADVNAIQ
jgi:hypothetical protein